MAVSCDAFRLGLSRLVHVLVVGLGTAPGIDDKQDPDKHGPDLIPILVFLYSYHYGVYLSPSVVLLVI